MLIANMGPSEGERRCSLYQVLMLLAGKTYTPSSPHKHSSQQKRDTEQEESHVTMEPSALLTSNHRSNRGYLRRGTDNR